jgi:hypothetical protein
MVRNKSGIRGRSSNLDDRGGQLLDGESGGMTDQNNLCL